jgi:hypothetical protein
LASEPTLNQHIVVVDTGIGGLATFADIDPDAISVKCMHKIVLVCVQAIALKFEMKIANDSDGLALEPLRRSNELDHRYVSWLSSILGRRINSGLARGQDEGTAQREKDW